MKYQHPIDHGIRPKSARKRRRWLLIPASIAVLTATLLLDSYLRLVTTEYDVPSDRLPQSFDGFRILQVSDLHGREFGKNNEQLVTAVIEAAPDIIVMTGDFIEGEDELPTVETLARQLAGIAPTYFVSGNHDWGSGKIKELRALLEDCGVTYLSNDYLELTRGGESIILAGVEDPNSLRDMVKPDELVDIINAIHPDSYIALLGHRNDFTEKYPFLNVDIIFSGHGHGGLVRIPGVGGVFGTNLNFFPEYDRGVFHSGRYDMVVSSGLAPMAIPRFLNNPELVVVNLRCT